jgi:formylglycine-generating enzyme required for sulfatase activity
MRRDAALTPGPSPNSGRGEKAPPCPDSPLPQNWERGAGGVRAVSWPRLMSPVALLLCVALCLYLSSPADGNDPSPPSQSMLVNPIDGAEMVAVPAGEFPMGSEKGQEDEKPVHTVRLKAFRIYKTEVTNAQYAGFLAATGHREPLFWKEERFNGPKQPVVGVDWHDAAAYCRWAKVRLPTEAEWEYAARGSDGREFPWPDTGRGGRRGGATEERAVIDLPFNSGKPAEVGSKPAGASPFGVLDMAGNVWEWCADWYDRGYYARSPGENPTGPEEGTQRVLRGGSWGYPSNVRAAYRFPERPTFRAAYVGFRAVQDEPVARTREGD